MASLEQILRPFEAPKPFDQRRIIATATKLPSETAHITWGSAGTLPTAIESAVNGPAKSGGFNTKKEKDEVTEKSRETEKVKIIQEGNPDNYVVYERPKSMTFSRTDGTKDPTFLTKPAAAVQTVAVKQAAPPPTDLGGDIPVTVQGDVLFVDRRNLPDQRSVPGDFFQVGDRVFTYQPPPLTANESVVP
jgi:hypothetical protein